MIEDNIKFLVVQVWTRNGEIKCVAKGKTAEFIDGIRKDKMLVSIVGNLITLKQGYGKYFVEIVDFIPIYEEAKHMKSDFRNAEDELGVGQIEKIGVE